MHLRKKSKRKPTHTLHPMCTAGNHNKKRMGVGKETVRVRGGKETVGGEVRRLWEWGEGEVRKWVT